MFHAPEVKAVSVLVHVERFMVILLCFGITCYHVHSEDLHVQRVAPIVQVSRMQKDHESLHKEH